MAASVAELGFTPRLIEANGSRRPDDGDGAARRPPDLAVVIGDEDVCGRLRDDAVFADVPILLSVRPEELDGRVPRAEELLVPPFTPAELAVYGEYELQTLEGVLRDGDGPHMAQVAATIAHKIGRPAPDDAAGFLGAYYAALRQQLEGGRRLGRRKADKHTAEQEA